LERFDVALTLLFPPGTTIKPLIKEASVSHFGQAIFKYSGGIIATSVLDNGLELWNRLWN